jgi:hypothetical protein
MQIQGIADRAAGLEVTYDSRLFDDPYRSIYEALRDVHVSGEGVGSVNRVILEALQDREDKQEIFTEILTADPGGTMDVESLADIADGLPPIEYEWYPWLPKGLLTVLGASQGVGKSFVGLDLAHRVIDLGRWPDGDECPRPGWPVVYLDAESVPQLINERADYYGMDKSKLYLLHAGPGGAIDLGEQAWRDYLIETVAATEPALLIIDSLSAIHSKGQNNVEDVRALLGFLTQLTDFYQIATLLIHHIRKPGGGVQMQMFDLDLSDLSGSSYITQVARVVWGLHIVQTEQEPDPNGPREMRMLKNNLGPTAEPMTFEFVPLHPRGVGLKWKQGAPERYHPPTCKDWLADFLQSSGEPVRPSEVIAAGELEGHARRTIYRARARLKDVVQDTEENRQNPNNCWEWVGDA